MKKIISLLIGFVFFGNSIFTWNTNKTETMTDINNKEEVVDSCTANQDIKCTNYIKEIKIAEIEKTVKNEIEVKQEEFEKELEKIKYIEDNKEWFLSYKELTFKYAEWCELPKTVFDDFSEEEVTLICRVVETECHGQDFDSKVNVANVIFNRLDSGKFGDTITEIITRPKQFVYTRTDLAEDTILAVQYAYEVEDTTQGALFFHSNEKTETFNKRKWIFTDKAGHHFY